MRTTAKNTAIASAILFALPLIASAQVGIFLGNVYSLVEQAGRIVAMLVPILVAAAMVFFFYGLIQWIRNPGKKGKGKQTMIAGLGALFVMATLWGLVRFGQDALGIAPGAPAQSPSVPVPRY